MSLCYFEPEEGLEPSAVIVRLPLRHSGIFAFLDDVEKANSISYTMRADVLGIVKRPICVLRSPGQRG